MSWIEDYANNILNPLPVQGDFAKLFPWETYFDPQLAQAGAMQRAEGYYLPLLERQIDATRQDFANRNLFRSGMRGYTEDLNMQDIADAQQQMVDTLAAQREAEARSRYATLQSQYEQNPTGYQAPAELTPPKQTGPTDYYGYRQGMYGSTPTVGYKYGIGTEEGSPYKYGQSYKQWWENKYKRTY